MPDKSRKAGGKASRIAALASSLLLGSVPAAPLFPDAPAPALHQTASLIQPRSYQMPVWCDHSTPLVVLEFGRQLGKSFTLADWAVDQLLLDLAQPGINTSLVTVLSNSKANGQEFALKAAEVARRVMEARGEVETDFPDSAVLRAIKFDEMRFELRIRIGDKVGRILVLAANVRTARGFSGHLILDEFAFHQDAAGIWEAAEPIVSSRVGYLCRIASTHNGKRTLFYQMAKGGDFPVWSVARSDAWAMGQGDRAAWDSFTARWKAFDETAFNQWFHDALPIGQGCSPELRAWLCDRAATARAPVRPVDVVLIKSLKRKGQLITPDEAEREATDRRAYRQNYENEPGDEGGALIGMPAILQAERAMDWTIDEGENRWSPATLERLRALPPDAEVYAGMDVGRTVDLTTIPLLLKLGQTRRQIGMFIGRELNHAHLRRQCEAMIEALGGRLRGFAIDFTGVGTGVCDELHDKYGDLIIPVHFGSTVPLTEEILAEGRKQATMKITEKMGNGLMYLFRDGHIEIIQNQSLRDDLNRPGRVVNKNGTVSIAAERNKADHSDRFWGLALAEHAVSTGGTGAWTPEQLSGTAIGHCGVQTLTTFSPVQNAARGFSGDLYFAP